MSDSGDRWLALVVSKTVGWNCARLAQLRKSADYKDAAMVWTTGGEDKAEMILDRAIQNAGNPLAKATA